MRWTFPPWRNLSERNARVSLRPCEWLKPLTPGGASPRLRAVLTVHSSRLSSVSGHSHRATASVRPLQRLPSIGRHGVGGPYPFFQGNYITVPTFPATSCSGQIPALRVPSGKQTPVSVFIMHPTESTQAKLSRYTFSLPAPHPPCLS